MTREPMVMLAFRIPRGLRDAANTKAADRDEYLSDVIRRALERYVARKDKSRD